MAEQHVEINRGGSKTEPDALNSMSKVVYAHIDKLDLTKRLLERKDRR